MLEEQEECEVVCRLRILVADLQEKNLPRAAVFFADKLVSLSDGAAADVFALARALVADGQHLRALQLLRAESLDSAGARCRHLAGQCLLATGTPEEALLLLGEEEGGARSALGEQTVQSPHALSTRAEGDGGLAMHAALALLRGHCHSKLENRADAARSYKVSRQVSSVAPLVTPPSQAALAADPLCWEAFDALVGGQMLTPAEEAQLLAGLPWAPGDAWIGSLYRQQAGAHDPGADMPALVAELRTAVCAAGAGAEAGGLLQGNADVVAAHAAWTLERGDADGAYAMTAALLAREAHRAAVLPTHVAAAAQLGKRNELFALGHTLAGADTTSGVAWLAVGAYYLTIGQVLQARRFLAKATQVAPGFAPAWLAYGHAFAASDEADAALVAYRTAARLFPGSPAPLLALGQEYSRAGSLPLAQHFLAAASAASPHDPAPHHELGCVLLRERNPAGAQAEFETALRLAPQPLTPAWEPTLYCLGHALRQQGRWEAAETVYRATLGLIPRSAPTLVALAFTAQLRGDSLQAVELYHAALSLRPDDR